MRNIFAQEKSRSPLWGMALPVLLFCLLAGFLWVGSTRMMERTQVEQLRSAGQAVRRAAVQCYALEGTYPTTVDYLIEHYGLQVDQERYLIHYEYVGGNLAPQITVLPREAEKGGE